MASWYMCVYDASLAKVNTNKHTLNRGKNNSFLLLAQEAGWLSGQTKHYEWGQDKLQDEKTQVFRPCVWYPCLVPVANTASKLVCADKMSNKNHVVVNSALTTLR